MEWIYTTIIYVSMDIRIFGLLIYFPFAIPSFICFLHLSYQILSHFLFNPMHNLCGFLCQSHLLGNDGKQIQTQASWIQLSWQLCTHIWLVSHWLHFRIWTQTTKERVLRLETLQTKRQQIQLQYKKTKNVQPDVRAVLDSCNVFFLIEPTTKASNETRL